MNNRILTAFVVCASALHCGAQPASDVYTFTTFAGQAGVIGATDGVGGNARFYRPWGIAVDAVGNVYVAEAVNHTIRKITPGGVVTTLAGLASTAGSADGIGTAARFGVLSTSPFATATSPTGPFALTVDGTGNVFVADTDSHTIRRIAPGQAVSTFGGAAGNSGYLDGPLAVARFSMPLGVAIDSTGAIFVADCYNHVIRHISPAGVVTTIAGAGGEPGAADGIDKASRFLNPSGITISPTGAVYVIDCYNTVRRLTLTRGQPGVWEVTTIASTPGTYGRTDGTGADARFGAAPPMTLSGLPSIRLALTPPGEGVVSNRPAAHSYAIGELTGIAADAAGNVYVADYANHTIRKISPSRVVTTIGGSILGNADGIATTARFNAPAGIAVDAAGFLYVADSLNHTIRKGGAATAPVVQAQASSQIVGGGATVELAVTVSGFPTPTVRWARNGVTINGATTSTLTLTNIGPAQGGTYTATFTNSVGSASIEPVVLSIAAAPVITVQPVAASILGAQTVTLRVTAVAAPAPTYQWTRNGEAIVGATNATLTVTNAQAEHAGDYRVIVTNANGSATSNAATVGVNTGRIVNLSIRSALVGSSPLIAGFVVSGGSKPMLVRAIGPALRQFGVGAAMADPQLSLQIGTNVVSTNDNWSSSTSATQIAAAATQVGAFALTTNSLDAAVLTNINNNSVTAQTFARNSAGGVVLLELYDAGPVSISRLVNVSTRAQVGVGENALFAGFSLGGNTPRTLMIRAIGPTLAALGVSGVLADPLLEIFDAGATSPRSLNDDWNGDTALVTAFSRVGAFPLPATTSRDSALVVTLEPGTYSAKISGVGNTTGEVLFEVYEVP